MIRAMKLPAGWYPRGAEAINEYLRGFLDDRNGEARAALAPHAGWFFSGKIAARAIAALRQDAATVVVAGGHLPAKAPVLFAEEDAVAVPSGEIFIDADFRASVKKELSLAGIHCAADRYADNTVEVLLPAVRCFFPKSRLLWLRVGAGEQAFKAGVLIARAASALGRGAVMLASSDLTHYGPNYDFCPKGLGKPALEWVKTVNDRRFIEAVLSGSAELVLERAEKEQSACSAGAVLCGMGFASETRRLEGGEKGVSAARLLAYGTSVDAYSLAGSVGDQDSFVGYAAISL
ncbi:MAG: AmmeMemoRadiSam system protein B [Spirochaetaceae bacterium]|nr:AmmeMemoRadiSam system protein B [Spirochaetaceae bacterium]